MLECHFHPVCVFFHDEPPEPKPDRQKRPDVETDFGPFVLHTYRDTIEGRLHLALLRGEPQADKPFLVRVHVQNPLSDVLAIQRADFGLPVRTALSEIATQGSGVVLVLGGHGTDEELLRQIQQQPEPSVVRNGDDRRSRELRSYGIGAQIIVDLGVRKMRVLSAPWKLTGLAGFGLEVSEYVNPDSVTDAVGGSNV